MEHNRKQKLLVVFALFIAIASLSVGFAAFATTLNISSSASVTPNSGDFKIRFSTSSSSTVVAPVIASYKSAGVTATDGTIINNSTPTITNISATFTEPGQSVSYVVYVRNDGEYTAYLNNVNFIGNKTCVAESGTSNSLVQAACEELYFTVNIRSNSFLYDTDITGYALEPGQSETIYIGLDYLLTGTIADGPFRITFPSISLVYSTVDNPSMDGKVVRIVSGDINTEGSIVAIGNEQFYVFDKENGNVKLLSMYNLRVGNSVDEEWNITPLTNQTGIQDSEARGYVYGEFPSIGTTAFSSDSQKGTNYSDYSGSIVEGYVNSYETYLSNMGAGISSARLITNEELEKLGCSVDSNSCSAAPNWVYSTSYWAASPYNATHIWRVVSDTSFGERYYKSGSDGIGVRPVIEIPESDFQN